MDQDNRINNNSSGEENQTGNMYSYNGYNEPPQESNAIRRSIGTGDNPHKLKQNNNINNSAENQGQNYNRPSLGNKNQKNPDMQNYAEKSSEHRFSNLKESQSPFVLPVSAPYDDQDRRPLTREPKKFYWLSYLILTFLQIIFIVLIGVLYELGNGSPSETTDTKIEFSYYYHFFKDVHLMLFIGFGLLYAALKDHQWSSIGIIFFIGSLSFIISFFWNYLWYNSFYNREKWERIQLNFDQLIQIDYITAPVFISLGAYIGKLSIIQYFFIAFFETFFSSLNYYLCYTVIGGVDNGGSLYIHAFGAIFGVVLIIVNFCRTREHMKISNSPHLSNDYYSSVVAFIGTLFLWVYFPSFNVARIQSYDEFRTKYKRNDEDIASTGITTVANILRYRGIVNTYLSMVGSVIGAFVVSPLLSSGFFKIEHLLNASFVGGIIIGGCCTICSQGWGAVLIGFIGGCVSALGLAIFKKLLKERKFDDTFGIAWTFGVPGILGGFLNSIFMGNFAHKNWGDGKIEHFFGLHRNTSRQGGLQILVILITIILAAIGGMVVGAIIRFVSCDRNEIYFVDSELFIEDENIPMPEWKYPRVNNINLSSSGNKLDDQEREVEIQQ